MPEHMFIFNDMFVSNWMREGAYSSFNIPQQFKGG